MVCTIDASGRTARRRGMMCCVEARGKQDYFDAGMALLADGGVQTVTIARLCSALGVTKGSFYHHFRGVEDFKAQLLADWSSERESQVIIASRAVADPFRRLEVLREAGIALHHEAEVAIRAWSRTDTAAWEVRNRVDAAREHALADAFREVGMDSDVADLLGRIAVVVLIGAQHRTEVTDRTALTEMYTLLTDIALRVFVPDRDEP